jgi:hypothetical protein
MNKYAILIGILDKLRNEAATTNRASTYLPRPNEIELINQARSRAFIHL